jgi:hypothetical protein
MIRPLRTALLSLCVLTLIASAEPAEHLSCFGAGEGPRLEEGVFHLLDAAHTKGQSNAVAFDRQQEGAFETTTIRFHLRVLEGGEGGAFVLLNTADYGTRGPAPFVKSWVEPNLRGTFAVGIDVHDPKDEEMFSAKGNYRGEPEREVSLHWDGREIVKRCAQAEFRGDWVDGEILVHHVVGGAEVSVQLGPAKVYDRTFIPGFLPYEARLAIGAGTSADATTELDVKDLRCEETEPAHPRRAPLHFDVFNHVLTDNSKVAFDKEVDLPPASWEFGRVILTLDIHDAGPGWDEWDRNGEVSIFDAAGARRGIVPFITSYRTECHWAVDVTQFRPWLQGKTRIEVAAGTTFYKNRGFMMSVALDFYHGRPELEPYRIEPIWTGIAVYQSEENRFRDFFAPKTVSIDKDAKAARLFVTTTGHSQVGEFTPSTRTIVFRPDVDAPAEQRFEGTLWKDDCYLNPNRPQFGTWKFSRAGWAPGDVVHPWWIDLSGALQPGKTAELRYEPGAYDFGTDPKPPQEEINKATQVVRAYLILYRAPGETMPAPALRVAGVVDGSNAALAGMKEGDYLALYDGKTLRSLEDLHAALAAAAQGGRAKIPVVLYRGAERLDLEIPPGRMGVNLAER